MESRIAGSAQNAYTRATWGNRLEFFFAMLGSCVGLGNVWRFPFLCYKNGGGAFLIPYIVMVTLVGLPVFLLETGIGQFSSQSAIRAWKLSPVFKGVGVAAVFVAFYISWYYNVLVAQFLYYLLLSMAEQLPWTGCCDWWGASSCCRQCHPNDSACVPMNCRDDFDDVRNTTNCTSFNLPAQEFYSTYVLHLTDGIENYGSPVWQLALCLLGVWFVVALILVLGAQSFGKAAYFTALFPYVMLTVMLVRGATLPGSGIGIMYYIVPDWQRLLDPKVWMEAGGQAFYSISAAMGVLTSLGSYNKFDHPLLRDGVIIVIMDMFTSIFSGFVVFCVLGYMSEEKRVPINQVADGGSGLVFEVYPAALSTMPVAQLWSVLFFLMMLTLGLGSSLSTVETVLISIQDVVQKNLGKSKCKKIGLRVGVCLLLYLLGLAMTFGGGTYLLTLVDEAVSKFILLTIGLVECIVIAWIYGWRRFQIDIATMTGWRPNFFIVACWTVVSPTIIVVILAVNIFNYSGPSFGSYSFPPWAFAIEMTLIFLPILSIPAYFLYYHCVKLNWWAVVQESTLPKTSWGPADSEAYRDYMEKLPDNYKFQTNEGIVRALSDTLTPAGVFGKVFLQKRSLPGPPPYGYTEVNYGN